MLIINQWEGTDFCMTLNLSSIGLPVPDDCFADKGPRPTMLPNNVTLPNNFPTIPPHVATTISVPTVDELRDLLEDYVFSNDSCLVKDLIKCPESHPVVMDGTSIIPEVNYNPANFQRDAGLLVVIAIAFRVMAYAVLAFRFRSANR